MPGNINYKIKEFNMQRTAMKNWPLHLLLIGPLSLWAVPSSAALKTDIVIFNNGDKLIGELKSLSRGQLNLNTEATGTIGFEWDKVSNVISKQKIQVETSNSLCHA